MDLVLDGDYPTSQAADLLIWRAARDSTPSRQLRRLVLTSMWFGSRWIWPAQVGWVVGPDGSGRVPSDRLDDRMLRRASYGESQLARLVTQNSVTMSAAEHATTTG
jgi:hypothetical protein